MNKEFVAYRSVSLSTQYRGKHILRSITSVLCNSVVRHVMFLLFVSTVGIKNMYSAFTDLIPKKA